MVIHTICNTKNMKSQKITYQTKRNMLIAKYSKYTMIQIQKIQNMRYISKILPYVTVFV